MYKAIMSYASAVMKQSPFAYYCASAHMPASRKGSLIAGRT